METKYNYKTALLIDDVELDNFVSQAIITTYHFAETIYAHASAESALAFLKGIGQTSDFQFPEVIFIDINMPVTDGFLFLKNLKIELKNEIALAKPKLVMLTSSVFNSDLQRAKAEFEDITFIVKPLTEEKLKLI